MTSLKTMAEVPRVVFVGPGWKARLHLVIYSTAAKISRVLFSGRGLQRLAVLMSRVFGTDGFAVFRVFDNRTVKIPLRDRYWLIPLVTGGHYEPEIRFVLTQFLKLDSVFIDCGANIGWWSLYASTLLPSPDQILAIEASPSVFKRLMETAKLNMMPFVCLNAAVWDQTELALSVSFHEVLHSAASVTEPAPPGFTLERVTSIRIDDAAERYLRPAAGPIIIKLDVEGAEIQALRGAQRLVAPQTLLIYEDHGKDPLSVVTKTIISMGWGVFFCDERLRIQEIDSAERLLPIKTDRRKGYNFFACRPGPLHEQFVALRERPGSTGEDR